jgi:hypothetical protein
VESATGESGGGKSALLANWTHGWHQRHQETPVLVHFIGAASDGCVGQPLSSSIGWPIAACFA